jgi:hypothetical protein
MTEQPKKIIMSTKQIPLILTDMHLAAIERQVNEVRVQRALRAAKSGGSANTQLALDDPTVYSTHAYLAPYDSLIKPMFGNAKPPPPPPPPVNPQLGPWSTGSITFDNGVPVGGWGQLTLFSNGNYTFSGHFHDSGATSYDVEQSWVVVSSKGIAFTFTASGHCAGTFESGSRDYDWTDSGNNAAIAQNWADLNAGYSWRWQAGANWDASAMLNSLLDAIKAVGTVVTAVINVVAAF